MKSNSSKQNTRSIYLVIPQDSCVKLTERNIISIESTNYSEIDNFFNIYWNKDLQSIDDLQRIYDRLFARTNLPEKIRRLENETRHYNYLWMANYCYQNREYSSTINYLYKSLKHTQSKTEAIIDRWITFLADNSPLNYQKVEQTLATHPDWQKLINFTHKSQPPQVTIIIPTYNCSQYLPQAIDSVLNQTYNAYEIIVIDDGSFDNTSKIIEPYLPKIRYVYQENQGVSEARNRGLYLARGELIAFLDADDIFLPTKLEKQVAIFETHPEIGIVNSGFQIIKDNGDMVMNVERWHEIPELTPEIWVLHKPVLPSAMMFRKEWFDRVGGFDRRYFSCEDVEITLRMIIAGCRSLWLPEVTVGYRRHQQSATWANSLRQAKNAEEMQNDFFARKDLPESIRSLEKQSHFYNLTWLAWLCYQSGNFTEMAEYLEKSRNYTPYGWVETIAIWIYTFENCAKTYACDFDAIVLSNLQEWQQIVAKLQTSRLFNSYYDLINSNISTINYPLKASENSLYAKTFWEVGNHLLKNKQIERAIDFYNRAIELEPKNAEYHQALAKAFVDRYELKSAVMTYRRAIELKPNCEIWKRDFESVLKLQQRWQKLTDYCQEQTNQIVKNSSLKILTICPYTPYPPQKGGGAIRMFEQIKYFGSRHQVTVVAFIFTEEDYKIEEQLAPYCHRAFMVKLGERIQPEQPDLHDQIYGLKTWNMWKTLEQLSQIDFDIVCFDFIVSTSYYPLFVDRFTVLHEHNIESKILQRCASEDNIKSLLNLEEKIAPIKPFLNPQSQAKLLAQYEERTWQQFPLRTVVSNDDKQELDSRCTLGKTIVVKNGIDTQTIDLVNNHHTHKLLYMGTMTYYPNIDAVLYFVDRILPEITRLDPTTHLIIAGHKPPLSIQKLVDLELSLEIVADPEDMSEIAAECSISVVPLRLGGGTRIKILHSMAMGLPIISTSLGCEGLDVIDGKHLLIRDNPQQFAEAVLQLNSDRDLWQQLRDNGRKLVVESYDWQQIFAEYETELLQQYYQFTKNGV